MSSCTAPKDINHNGHNASGRRLGRAGFDDVPNGTPGSAKGKKTEKIFTDQSQSPAAASLEGPPGQADEDGSNFRNIIAAICQSAPSEDNGQCRTEIRFAHDNIWTATALRSGAYEFVSHPHGGSRSIARWVPKKESRNAEDVGNTELPEPRFRFSLVDARSRRHPVIANMSRQLIEVYDRYSIPDITSKSLDHGNPKISEASLGVDNGDIGGGEGGESCKMMIETDDQLRSMIMITGIWVAFCEQWSPNFRYSTKQVISNGISELSNRRRSEGAQPIAFGRKEEACTDRPDKKHTPSLSSIPSSPPSGSPAASPQRTASTSTTVFGDHQSQYGALSELDHTISPTIGDHDEGELYQTAPLEEAVAGTRLGEKPSGSTEHFSSQYAVTREEGEQSFGGNPVGIERNAKRPGKFKRVLGRLKGRNS
ncbi:MAG: hypothetical protein Q9200_005828 [Gallowayella weberi]